MKKKSKNTYSKNRKEFRFKNIEISNKAKMRHPVYVFVEKGNVYFYVNLTHSKEIAGKVVIKLTKNPNPDDRANSYFIEEIHEDTKDKFGKRLLGWEMDPKDDEIIRKLYKKKMIPSWGVNLLGRQ